LDMSQTGRRFPLTRGWRLLVVTISVFAGLMAALVPTAGEPGGDVRQVLALLERTLRDPAASGIKGYSGQIEDGRQGVVEVGFIAPHTWLMRTPFTGYLHGVLGNQVWDYNPSRGEGLIVTNAPLSRTPPVSPLPLPGEPRPEPVLEEFTRGRGEPRLLAEETVLDRPAYVLFFPAGSGAGELRVWVDKATGIALRVLRKDVTGRTVADVGFTSFHLGVPERPLSAWPDFPTGTAVVTETYGTPEELSLQSGIPVWEPRNIPREWVRTGGVLVTFDPSWHRWRESATPTTLSWGYLHQGKEMLRVSISRARLNSGPGQPIFTYLGSKLVAYTRVTDAGWEEVEWDEGGFSINLGSTELNRAALGAFVSAMPSSIGG
jgi:hypothetical protein